MQEKCWPSVTIVNERKLYTKLISSPKLFGWYQFHEPALPLGKKFQLKKFFFLIFFRKN